MAIYTKKAKKLLTKAEQKHLTRDAGIRSMAGLKRQVEFMAKRDPQSQCFECKHIARKLGMEVKK